MGDVENDETKQPSFTLESLIGRTFDDRYAIDELIGMGGMGAVYRARQTRLRRTVAIKVPKPQYCFDKEFLARFEREALSMAKLIHEHVVQIIDVYISDDPTIPSFIAMEYIEGFELEKFLRSQEEKLTVAAVTDLFCQIARGIDAAHSRGIIHRDIKPSNIVITMPNRIAKIMDFGIARVDMEDVFATADESAIGTPAFMAPEQVQGRNITQAADIYAFGMTLYRLLTRTIAFPGGSASSLLYAQVNDPPISILERNPLLPPAVESALMPALEKEPSRRPNTATELAERVKSALSPMAHLALVEIFPDETQTMIDGTTGLMRSVQKSKPRTALYAAVAIPIVLVVGIGGYLLASRNQADNTPAADPGTQQDPPPADMGAGEQSEPPSPPPTVLPIATTAVAETSVPPSPEPTPEQPKPTTSTPEPTAKPSPEPTPRVTTPVPTTVVATTRPPRTVRPPSPTAPDPTPQTLLAPEIQSMADDPASWDPEVSPPVTALRPRRNIQMESQGFIERRIERPIHHQQFTQTVLSKAPGEDAGRLLAALESLAAEYDPLDIRLARREDSIYWEDRALLRLDVVISGKPLNRPEPDYRRRILSAENAIEMKVLLADGELRLLSLVADDERLGKFLGKE